MPRIMQRRLRDQAFARKGLLRPTLRRVDRRSDGLGSADPDGGGCREYPGRPFGLYVTGDRYWVWVPDPGRSFAGEVGREPGRLRVGLVTGSPLGGVHADCVTAAEDAAVLLEELGHYVSPAELAPTEDYVRDFQTVWFASLAATEVPDWR